MRHEKNTISGLCFEVLPDSIKEYVFFSERDTKNTHKKELRHRMGGNSKEF